MRLQMSNNEQIIIMNNGTLSVTSFIFLNLLYILIVIDRCWRQIEVGADEVVPKTSE